MGGLAHRPDSLPEPSRAIRKPKKSWWSDEELADLRELVSSGVHIYKSGMHQGKTCYPAIAAILNERYKKQRPARRANAFLRRLTRPEEPNGVNEENTGE